MSFRVLVSVNRQQPSGMMSNYQWAYFIGSSLLIIVIIVVATMAFAFPREPSRGTITEETVEKAEKVQEILIWPYCKARNSPSAKFCRNCGASLES